MCRGVYTRGHFKRVERYYLQKPNKPKIRALVVEDHDINQELMKEMLERLECKVDIAPNGAVALSNLSAKDYDIIFMDLHMPEMDGFEATKAIRKKEQGSLTIPIIALTASDLPGYKQKCFDVGIDACLSKPFEIQDIEQVLKRYLPSDLMERDIVD
jgi:CheY-like chemotaxis protein